MGNILLPRMGPATGSPAARVGLPLARGRWARSARRGLLLPVLMWLIPSVAEATAPLSKRGATRTLLPATGARPRAPRRSLLPPLGEAKANRGAFRFASPRGPQANSEFGIRSSEFIEKRTVQTVGAPSASLRPCGRPRGMVLVSRIPSATAGRDGYSFSLLVQRERTKEKRHSGGEDCVFFPSRDPP